MNDSLRATNRDAIAQAADSFAHQLKSDELIEINLDTLESHVNGPFTPDWATPISLFRQHVKEQDWPENLSASLIGSCTDSSYEDLGRSASTVQRALNRGIKPKSSLFSHTRL